MIANYMQQRITIAYSDPKTLVFGDVFFISGQEVLYLGIGGFLGGVHLAECVNAVIRNPDGRNTILAFMFCACDIFG